MGKGVIRESCTGVWEEQFLLLEPSWLHLLGNRVDRIGLRKRGSFPLASDVHAEIGDDSLCLKIIMTEGRPPIILRAQSTPMRNEWVQAINASCSITTPVSPIRRFSSSQISSTSLNSSKRSQENHTTDYFGSEKVGYLSKRNEKAWMEGWKNRWFVLHENRLDYFDLAPCLSSSKGALETVQVVHYSVYVYANLTLFRLVSPTGSIVDLRVDRSAFPLWNEALEHIEGVRMITEENGLGLVKTLLGTSWDASSKLTVRVEGHQVLIDHRNLQYAAFVVHTITTTGPVIVHRRFSQFRTFHRQLRLHVSADVLPLLPHSRLWSKLDGIYLKTKAVQLQGYLVACVTFCTTGIASTLLLEFLTDHDEDRESESSEEQE